MNYVGVDIAKHNHYACVLSQSNAVLTAPFAFSNDIDGYTKFVNAFKKLPKNDVIIGLESTSIYGENLIEFLAEKGYKIALINPIETASLRRSRVRNSKTDKVDSRIICQFLLQNEYRLLQPKELKMLQLRGLCRFRLTLTKSRTRLKTQLVSYVDIVFPEYSRLFKPIHGKGSYAVLSEFPSATSIAKANVARLTNLLSKASRGCVGKARADELKQLAKRSVGTKSSDFSFQISHTITQIQMIETQLKEVEKRITTVFLSLDSVIATIPGVGAINGAMILSEIGDIKRFSNPSQLIAFAGLDPNVRQSGNFQAKTTRMSKRGSSTLRFALVNAAHQVSLNNATFAAYYEQKFAEKGRHYKTLGHVAGKLCRVIFKMLKGNEVFNLP
jgi:transposase